MVLQERGMFWLADQIVPDRHFAPDSAVPGLLTIEDNGRIVLELDSFLSPGPSPLAAFARATNQESRACAIRGILKGTNKHVLMLEALNDGAHLTSMGMSYESFRARYCLLGEQPFKNQRSPHKFRGLEVNLHGFQDWLRLRSIQTVRSGGNVRIKSTKPKDASYPVPGGQLRITFFISSPISKSQTHTASIREEAWLTLQLDGRHPVTDLIVKYRILGDLLVLLMNSEFELEWPYLTDGKKTRYLCYFRRMDKIDNPPKPSMFESPTNFVLLRDNMGEIYSNWVATQLIVV